MKQWSKKMVLVFGCAECKRGSPLYWKILLDNCIFSGVRHGLIEFRAMEILHVSYWSRSQCNLTWFREARISVPSSDTMKSYGWWFQVGMNQLFQWCHRSVGCRHYTINHRIDLFHFLLIKWNNHGELDSIEFVIHVWAMLEQTQRLVFPKQSVWSKLRAVEVFRMTWENKSSRELTHPAEE